MQPVVPGLRLPRHATLVGMPRRSGTPAPRYLPLDLFTAGRTVTVPAGVTIARFTALGGGSGGGGGLARAVMTVGAGQQIVVSVGAAGFCGTDDASGSPGGDSTILVNGLTITASGGQRRNAGGGGGTGSISSMSGVLEFVAWSGGNGGAGVGGGGVAGLTGNGGNGGHDWTDSDGLPGPGWNFYGASGGVPLFGYGSRYGNYGGQGCVMIEWRV